MRAAFLTSRRALLLGFGGAIAALPLRADPLPEIKVTKDPSCGCCEAWVEHLKAAGFPVEVTRLPVNPLKVKLGVPRDLFSCHTAQVGSYVLEGHVPADAIRRLLREKPKATGLAVPGMPVGSPGMEVEGYELETYDVVLFAPKERRVFATYRGAKEV